MKDLRDLQDPTSNYFDCRGKQVRVRYEKPGGVGAGSGFRVYGVAPVGPLFLRHGAGCLGLGFRGFIARRWINRRPYGRKYRRDLRGFLR